MSARPGKKVDLTLSHEEHGKILEVMEHFGLRDIPNLFMYLVNKEYRAIQITKFYESMNPNSRLNPLNALLQYNSLNDYGKWRSMFGQQQQDEPGPQG